MCCTLQTPELLNIITHIVIIIVLMNLLVPVILLRGAAHVAPFVCVLAAVYCSLRLLWQRQSQRYE